MSVDRKVLAYIKSNPGATPREIADALGLPYNVVRYALLRLREAGYLIRSSRGGYVVRVALPSGLDEELEGPTHPSTPSTGTLAGEPKNEEVIKAIQELKAIVEELRKRVERLEKELNLLKKGIELSNLKKQRREDKDPLIAELDRKGVVRLSEARKLARGSLDHYIRKGIAVPVGDVIASPKFLEMFKKKFPLRLGDVRKLPPGEKELLDAMIREGMVYLHGGREYRLIE